MVLEKKHRLDLSCYEGMTRASFTICIKHRKPVFVQTVIVKNFTRIFESSIRQHYCVNWVYLFMPDHFHFILEGTRLNANLWKAVVLFKQKLFDKIRLYKIKFLLPNERLQSKYKKRFFFKYLLLERNNFKDKYYIFSFSPKT